MVQRYQPNWHDAEMQDDAGGEYVAYDDHLAAVAKLQEQIKEIACEVCWTTSWTPIENLEDANGVNTKTASDGALTRCEHCWLHDVALPAAVEQAVKDERERCAKLVEAGWEDAYGQPIPGLVSIAAAIRQEAP